MREPSLPPILVDPTAAAAQPICLPAPSPSAGRAGEGRSLTRCDKFDLVATHKAINTILQFHLVVEFLGQLLNGPKRIEIGFQFRIIFLYERSTQCTRLALNTLNIDRVLKSRRKTKSMLQFDGWAIF